MVDALVTVAAEGILKKALSTAATEVALALGYKDKLAELQKTSKMIHAKLSDAEGKKSTGLVMEWLKQLNDVVGEADNVLDEAHYEMLRREVKKRNQAGKIFSFTILKKFSFGREMGYKIENINKELSQIYERANNLRLQDEHLALQGRGYENSVFDIFKEDMKKTRSLRTLFFLRGDARNISLNYFKCLRILKLSGSSLDDQVSESVGELVHLRYLDLSNTSIRTLPKSIGKLYHLQTLKRSTIRYVYSFEDLEFPQETKNLISLRHLVYDSRVQAPKDVGLLTSLRTLPSFHVGRQKGRQIEELGPLKHLSGKLRIWNLEEIDSKEEALKADLQGKQNLYEIEFHWRISICRDEGGKQNDKDVLEGLQPAANVKILKIRNYCGNSIPEWAMRMSSIRDIRFYECWGLNEESVLQGLPMEVTSVKLNGEWIRS